MKVQSLTRAPLHRKAGVAGFLLAAGLALATHSSFAHHSVAANFDSSRTVEVMGTITAVHLRNPHSQYVLAVPSEDGSTEEWLIEWSDRNALVRRKVDLDRIKVGDRVTITVWPSRRLESVGFFIQAVLPDGSVFRDCGFREFREAVVNSSEFSCPEADSQ